jgi:hypothetical protein
MSGFVYTFVDKKNGQYYLQYEGALEAFGAQSLRPNLPVMTGKKVIIKKSLIIPLGEYLWEDLLASHRSLAQKHNQKLQQELEEKNQKRAELLKELYEKKLAQAELIIKKYFPNLLEGENQLGFLESADLENQDPSKNWGTVDKKSMKSFFSEIESAGIRVSTKQWNCRLQDLQEKSSVLLQDGNIKNFHISYSIIGNNNSCWTIEISSYLLMREAESKASSTL